MIRDDGFMTKNGGGNGSGVPLVYRTEGTGSGGPVRMLARATSFNAVMYESETFSLASLAGTAKWAYCFMEAYRASEEGSLGSKEG
jgi:hypothetical protein